MPLAYLVKQTRFQGYLLLHAGGVRTMTSILVPSADAGSLPAKELERLGLRVVGWPELKVGPPENCFGLDEAIDNLFGYDWVVLKNDRAADSFLSRFQHKHEPDELDDLKTIAIGEPTGEILVRSQIHVDVAIDRFPSKNIFAAIERYAGVLSGLTFLLPSAGLQTESFEHQLTEAGARVDNVAAYQTTADNQRLGQLLALLVGGGIDGVVFANFAALDEFAQLIDTNDLSGVLAGVTVVCGDAEAAQAAHEYGLSANKVTPEPLSAETLAKLINASP
jgi:uroporphyrinogen-III synthase